MQFLLFLTLYICQSLAASVWFTTSTGRQISVSRLSSLFRTTPQEKWNSYIFELTTDEHLVTALEKISLAEVPFQRRLFMPNDDVSVVVDGKRRQDVSFEYLSKTVRGYTISYRLDKKPFSLSNLKAVLRPLHPDLHPGVYVEIPEVKDDNRFDDRDDDSALVIPKSKKGPSQFDTAGASTPCRRTSQQILLQLAVAFDSTLCSFYGSYLETLAIVTDAVHMGMIPYHRQTCVRLKIVYFEGFCDSGTDPYAAMVAKSDTLALMSDLRLLWVNSRSSVSRDLVYLFTGSGSDANAVGRAYLGAVCNTQYNVAWTEGIPTTTISHEIGHAFDAPHTTNGDIMSPSRDRYGPRYFSEQTLATFEAFIGAEGSCLSLYSAALPLLIPADVYQTCQSGFGGIIPTFQNWIAIKDVLFSFAAGTAKVRVYYYQSSLEMYVYLLADAGHRIVRYRRRPAMANLGSSLIGDWVNLDISTSEKTMSRWSWSEIDRPSSMSSCCNQQVFIHVQIRLCNNNGAGECLTRYSVTGTPVQC